MPFGSNANNNGFTRYIFSTYVPYDGELSLSLEFYSGFFTPKNHAKVKFQQRSYGINDYGVEKENSTTVMSLKELQMTRSEIYQALMLYILRSSDKERYGYPTEDINSPGKTLISNKFVCERENKEEKTCSRCKRSFNYNYLDVSDHCVFHWGKLRKAPFGGQGHLYTCCRQPKHSKGCSSSGFHVTSNIAINNATKFVKTTAPKNKSNSECQVFALDCEMCYTSQGLELTKVSLIGLDGTVVYNTFVKPTNVILDFNTQWSGVNVDDLLYCDKDLRSVQEDLLKIINSRTILIGHGLENDLKALHLIHSMVIDTSVVFPHHLGFPYRRSLKDLVACCLDKNIQKNEFGQGHDSVEDATSCVELMLWKLKQDQEQLKNKKNSYTYDPFD